MINDIKQLVSTCRDCIRVLQSQLANPMVTSPPSSHFGFPMQHIGLDLFSFGGKDYLICIDHWSGYPFYQLLCSLISNAILKILTSWFNLFGWPSSIRSDGGPQFCGEFRCFCEKHGIRHELSAPYNPKSNGLAEAGVKSVKNILRKCASSGADPDFMLYECPNVPRSDGYRGGGKLASLLPVQQLSSYMWISGLSSSWLFSSLSQEFSSFAIYGDNFSP